MYFTFAAHSENYKYRIDKISCASCIGIIKKTAQNYPELSDVEVTLEDKQLQFSCKKDKAADCRIEALLSDLKKKGYPAKKLD